MAIDRDGARRLIVAAANNRRASRGGRAIGMRHLNEAVAICRFRGLVEPGVLEAAGFRAVKKR